MYAKYLKRYGDLTLDNKSSYQIAKLKSKKADAEKTTSKYNQLRSKYDKKRGVGI